MRAILAGKDTITDKTIAVLQTKSPNVVYTLGFYYITETLSASDKVGFQDDHSAFFGGEKIVLGYGDEIFA